MTRVSFVGGAYESRSLIASSQRCVNLYPEKNTDPQAPVPVTYYQTAGLKLKASAPNKKGFRGLYAASNGKLFCCISREIFYIDPTFSFFKLGQIAENTTPVSFADNGSVLVLVDGTSSGYAINLKQTATDTLHAFAQISDPAFYGAAKVAYLDTYFAFNRQDTSQFYISLSYVSYAQLTYQDGAHLYGSVLKAGMGLANGTYTNVTLRSIYVTINNSGGGYTNGTYTNVSLFGGSGIGLTANITISNGFITSVDVINQGTGYATGDRFNIAASSVGGIGSGFIGTVNVSKGTGLKANIVVSGNAVTSFNVIPSNQGFGYSKGDSLIVYPTDIGGSGGGFVYIISDVATAFDPLDIVSKTGFADNVVSLTSVYQQLLVLGSATTELWVNTGSADFALSRLPAGIIEHGCAAPYSVARQDLNAYWLSQDREGHGIVVKFQGGQVERVSTKAIETIIQKYRVITDAIGYTYQIGGHFFYILTFPTENVTWQMDLETKQWNELASIDSNGNLNKHRSNCCAFAYGLNFAGDWQNGNLYAFDLNTYTDNGVQIPRIRTFPHLIQDGKRVTYTRFIADFSVGDVQSTKKIINDILSDFNNDFNLDFANTEQYVFEPSLVTLKWSDTKGADYNNGIVQTLGDEGEYATSVQWNRLGIARDRIFELSWSGNANTALNGAFIEVIPHGS